MPIIDLYSKRKKREDDETVEVFEYDTIPNELKVQITHMWDDAIGNAEDYRDVISIR